MIRKIVIAALCLASAAFGQAVGGNGVPGASSAGGTPCTAVVNGIQYNNAGSFGCNAALVFNPATGVLTASGYATGTATQGFITLQQNATAAPAQPANSYALLAPQSGLTSSYSNTVPLLAPTANNSAMLSPSGGGQMTWGVVPALGTANTFTALQTVNVAAGGNGFKVISGASVACYDADSSGTAGGVDWTICAGDNVFGPGSLYFNNVTAAQVYGAVNSRGFEVRAGQGFYYTPSAFDPTGSPDLGLSRCAAGVLCIGVGSASNSQGVAAANAFEAAGNLFAVAGCGTATGRLGGGTAGRFVGGSATCTPVITMGSFTANNGFACSMSDFTTPTALFQQSATTTTTATFTAAGTVGATDTISFQCLAY